MDKRILIMYEQREKWDMFKYRDGKESHVYDHKVGVEGGGR